jgi:hypothetical protein
VPSLSDRVGTPANSEKRATTGRGPPANTGAVAPPIRAAGRTCRRRPPHGLAAEIPAEI